MTIVSQFWEREPVKAVSSMKQLNFDNSMGSLPKGMKILPKRLKDQGIKMYYGAGVDS